MGRFLTRAVPLHHLEEGIAPYTAPHPSPWPLPPWAGWKRGGHGCMSWQSSLVTQPPVSSQKPRWTCLIEKLRFWLLAKSISFKMGHFWGNQHMTSITGHFPNPKKRKQQDEKWCWGDGRELIFTQHIPKTGGKVEARRLQEFHNQPLINSTHQITKPWLRGS